LAADARIAAPSEAAGKHNPNVATLGLAPSIHNLRMYAEKRQWIDNIGNTRPYSGNGGVIQELANPILYA
jgi:hypothetical protein